MTSYPEKKETYKVFNNIAHRYDLLNHLLSGGIDIIWRHKVLKQLPKLKNTQSEGLTILDLATGTGDLAFTLARSPKVRHVEGLDLSAGMLELAKKKSSKHPLGKKLNFTLGNAEELPFPDASFDVVTVAFGIRNFPNPLKALREMFRVLRPGGQVMVLELSLPTSPLVQSLYLFYFRHLLPRIGGLISGNALAYRYLNSSVEDFPSGQAFLKWPKEVGFTNLSAEPLTFGIVTLSCGKKDAAR